MRDRDSRNGVLFTSSTRPWLVSGGAVAAPEGDPGQGRSFRGLWRCGQAPPEETRAPVCPQINPDEQRTKSVGRDLGNHLLLLLLQEIACAAGVPLRTVAGVRGFLLQVSNIITTAFITGTIFPKQDKPPR